jgi:hypothetical protein
MATRVFFMNTLKKGVEASEYEQWVREVDYPLARALPAIKEYTVSRLEGFVQGDGELPCEYLEVIDVTDLDEYKAALSGGPEVEKFFEEWSSYVGESVMVHAAIIE